MPKVCEQLFDETVVMSNLGPRILDCQFYCILVLWGMDVVNGNLALKGLFLTVVNGSFVTKGFFLTSVNGGFVFKGFSLAVFPSAFASVFHPSTFPPAEDAERGRYTSWST